jgi:sugar phosphate isomerase/epimerase
MRLGANHELFRAECADDLEPLCEKLDVYGLSTIIAPGRLGEMPDRECVAFGERARSLGLTIGEVGYWQNLMHRSPDVRAERIAAVRRFLRQSELIGCGCVVTLVGTNDSSDRATLPHPTDPYMFSDACKAEFREIVLRILDGLELQRTRYVIEPWNNTFFYQPEDIRAFIDSVDHPMFGVHLDQMNMVSQQDYYYTTDLIDRTFDLLADRAFSVHLKDIRVTRESGDFVSFKEVRIGEGALDYETLLRRLSELPLDMPCYCEHLQAEGDYAINFARLHHIARTVGVAFVARSTGD